MKRILIITPHLSTGGAPQFTLNKIEHLIGSAIIHCVEYSYVSADFVVQRNKIIDLIGSGFESLGDNKYELLTIISKINPDIIFMEEFPENFMDDGLCKHIYKSDRIYSIIESTHSSIKTEKRLMPDKFLFVSKHSVEIYRDLGIDYDLIEYPLDFKKDKKVSDNFDIIFDPKYKHILNVGLFTHGKNQGYAFELARTLENYNVKFHFVGNLAGNFMDYWEPIMRNKPSNCIVYGERSDVDDFLKSSDLFLFTSNFELNPLVVREALSYKLPTLMFNLSTYQNSYDGVETISYLTGSLLKDRDLILKMLDLTKETIIENTLDNRNDLPNFLNKLGLTNNGVEVGTFKGEFSKTILDKWGGKLYMVDVWRPLSDEEYDDASNHKNHITAYSEAIDNISGYDDRAFMLRMKSEDGSTLFKDGSLDFVYIDANHSYEGVKSDINVWYPKVKSGGLVMGHDYLPKNMYGEGVKDIPLYLFPDGEPDKSYYAGMFGVNPAVDEFANDNGYDVNCTSEFLGTWWFIKE